MGGAQGKHVEVGSRKLQVKTQLKSGEPPFCCGGEDDDDDDGAMQCFAIGR
jgi:hypothetical protein